MRKIDIVYGSDILRKHIRAFQSGYNTKTPKGSNPYLFRDYSSPLADFVPDMEPLNTKVAVYTYDVYKKQHDKMASCTFEPKEVAESDIKDLRKECGLHERS
jgi:hypothetical protein